MPTSKSCRGNGAQAGEVVREIGNVDEAFAKGGKIVEAEY